jgi:hypothetical protein
MTFGPRRTRAAIAALATSAALAACAPVPEQTPMQRHVNRVAGAEIASAHCPGYGGYASVAQMRADAARNWQQAQAMGATDADLQAARRLVQTQFLTGELAVGTIETCQRLINSLAWVGATPTS